MQRKNKRLGKNKKLLKTWRKMKLGEAIELKYGYGLTEKNRENGNIPVFGSSGIVGKHNKAAVNSEGIIVGRKGNVGSVYYSNYPFYPIDTVYYIDSLKINGDLKFFYYFLKRIPFKNIGSDVGVPGLNRDIAYNLDVFIPENINEQKRIAGILFAFDDKIELNNKISRTLEEMASAIFKEWFVKFRFPGYEKVKMVDSESGKIPEGWKIERLIKVVDLIKGQKPKNVLGQAMKGAIEYLLINSFVSNAKFYTTDLATPKCEIGDSAVVMDGASSGRVFYGKNGAIGSTLAILKLKQGAPISKQYLFMFLKRIESELLDNLTGSAIPHLDKDFLKEHIIIIPNPAIMKMITETINTILDRQVLIVNENQTLSSLRDLLLPKLMSGKARV